MTYAYSSFLWTETPSPGHRPYATGKRRVPHWRSPARTWQVSRQYGLLGIVLPGGAGEAEAEAKRTVADAATRAWLKDEGYARHMPLRRGFVRCLGQLPAAFARAL